MPADVTCQAAEMFKLTLRLKGQDQSQPINPQSDVLILLLALDDFTF